MQISVEDIHRSILGGAHVFDVQFQFSLALPMVKHQAVGEFGLCGQGFLSAKPNAIDQLAM